MTLTGRSHRYPSAASAEERALLWLIVQDDLNYVDGSAANELALVQRYALSTLWFQTGTPFNGTEFTETWIQPDVNECDWFNVVCDAATGRVTQLVLDNDNVMGRIPADLGLLTDLTVLDLRNNQLMGTLPASLDRLTALQLLDLSENQLTGTIPSSWQMTLTALTHLDLAINKLTGNIPSSLEGLTALTGLILWENQLGGTIPASLGNVTALAELNLRSNLLTGTIPSSLGSLTALSVLVLYNNQFGGTMPVCGLAQNFTVLVTDCNEVTCPCCLRCCPTGGWNGIPGIAECDDAP
jgi:Leucine rich repeat